MLQVLVFVFSLADASIYQTQMKDISGEWVSFSKYKKKVVLAVNTASDCGYTPQLKGLEKLYQKYKGKGLVVLGFPSNDFNQEKLEGEKLKSFCKLKYGVSFPLFAKSHVKGENKNIFYKKVLKSLNESEVSWNFEKILIDSKGQVYKKFKSSVEPMGGELEKTVKRLLGS